MDIMTYYTQDGRLVIEHKNVDIKTTSPKELAEWLKEFRDSCKESK